MVFGVDRSAAYLTNAVKHFRFEQRGKRRIHQKPDVCHVTACTVLFRLTSGTAGILGP